MADSVQTLTAIDIEPIVAWLSSSSKEWEQSQLYMAATDEKLVDPAQRQSVFRTFLDSQLFDLAEAVVAQLSAASGTHDYVLVQNDLTHIKYTEGGFFKRHQDFLSLATNMVEEHTLLLCVTPPGTRTEGGATTIYTNDSRVDYRETATPGSALAFRKDLEHEGQLVTSGEKHILSMNLWAMRKRSGQVLHVTFGDGASAAGLSALRGAADDRKSYALATEVLKGTMLETHVEFVNREAESSGKPPPSVVPHVCSGFTFDEFGLVFRILNRMYLTADEVAAAKHGVLDYYCPNFKFEALLIDSAVSPSLVGQRVSIAGLVSNPSLNGKVGVVVSDRGGGRFGVEVEGERKPLSIDRAKLTIDVSAAAKKGATGACAAPDDDDAVIVCESEERTTVVSALARQLGLPYVPFRFVFVEGILQFRFEADYHLTKLPMLPAWLSLGDHENIFMYRRLVDKELEVQEECELTTIHRTANIFKHPDLIAAAAETSSGSSFEWPKSVELGRYDGILGDPRDNNWTSSDDKKDMPPGETVALGLMACFGPDRRKTSSTSPSSQLQRNIHRLLFDHEGTHINRLPLTLLPGTAPTEAMETDDEGAPDPEPSTRLFHIDDEGKTCFSREEAEAASQLVADMALDERVKQSIQHKRFVLPQQTQNIDGGFCNEAVYGRLNLLTVTGLVRLDSAKPIKAPSVKVAFDAWPSAKTLTDSAHKTFARHGAYGVVKGWQEGEMKDAYSAWY